MPHSIMFVISAMRRLGTKNSNATTNSYPYTNMNGVCSCQFIACGLVCPQYHGYIKVPIIPINVAYLHQCIFKDLIKGFHCSIHLRMVWCTLLMMNFKFLSHRVNSTVNEVSALVTHQNPRATKSSDHFLEQEVC
jgi:hypothetical protein